MSLKIIIHRGSREIGGTCIQLSTTKTSILLDIGAPLKKDSKKIDIGNFKVNAILLSHPHQDHYGLINSIDKSLPVYIGELGEKIIDGLSLFLNRELHDNRFCHYKRRNKFKIGDFSITPFLVDHSAVDSYAFLIEADGKRIFYSGDFRAHGNKSDLFKRIVENPPSNIDVLFMEGTMMERHNEQFPAEKYVKKEIYEVIKNQKNISFIISSSTNIDRIVSAYNACHKTSKILVLDLYTAWIIEQVKAVSKGIRAMNWDYIKVYANYNQYKVLKNNPTIFGKFKNQIFQYRVEKEEMRANPSHYLFFGKMSSFKVIDLYKAKMPVNVIYSQWLGYLNYSNEEYYGAKAMSGYQSDEQIIFTYAHTSGHAVLKDLQIFAKALNPKKLIPIHTEYREKFKNYFDAVLELSDGEELIIN